MFATPTARAFALLAVLLLTALLYWPGLGGPLLLDDRQVISPLAKVDAGELALRSWLFEPGEGGLARPLSRFSFYLDWRRAGDDVAAFKRTNLLLHLVCGSLVYLLASALLAHSRLADTASEVALFVASCWLLSPFLVSTVLYVVQRMTQLSALFTLAGLLSYVHARSGYADRPLRSWMLLFIALGVCWPLAIACKQNGALLPLLALIIEVYFLATLPGERQRRVLLAAVATAAMVLAALLLLDPDVLLGRYQSRDYSLAERVLTQARVLFDHVANLLVLPGGSAMALHHDDFPLSRGLLSPPSTLLSLLGWTALGFAAWKTRHGALSPIAFGVVFFLAAHLVESSVFPLEIYFEHRSYLPAFGPYFALGAALAMLRPQLAARRLLTALAFLIPAGFALFTLARVQVWQSEATLYAAAVASHPKSARARLGLASVYLNAADFERGHSELEAARALLGPEQQLAAALQELAAYCVHDRKPPDGAYQRVAAAGPIGSDPFTLNALAWFAEALDAGGCGSIDHRRLTEALLALRRAAASAGSSNAARRDRNVDALLSALKRR